MGLKNYFHPAKAAQTSSSVTHHSHELAQLSASAHGLLDHGGRPASTPLATPRVGSPAVSRPASRMGSRPFSLFEGVGGSDRSSQDILDIKCDVMVNYLYKQQQEHIWNTLQGADEGVVLKKSRGRYTCCPATLADLPNGFMKAVEALNVRVAITVSTRVIKLFLRNSSNMNSIPLPNGLRVQVLQDIAHLPRCQKHQSAAFIANSGYLVVWDDDPRQVIKRAEHIETQLLDIVWQDESLYSAGGGTKSNAVSVYESEIGYDGATDLKENAQDMKRPLVLWQPISVSLTIMILLAATGAGVSNIATEIYLDGGWIRLAFVVVWPFQVWLSLFFFQALVCTIIQLIGPVSQMDRNTKYYSGLKPRRLTRGQLPHLTVQMPCYKEGLVGVIAPTIKSIKEAISTYELQGGTANIFVNDDGMQAIPTEEAQMRKDFYEEHSIGWTARPTHESTSGPGGEIFLRRGKFKKASNMNYGMWVSTRIEDKLKAIARPEDWDSEDEAKAYAHAFNAVLEEDQGRTWAEGNLRIGDYILIIDCDTRVPKDCLLDAVSEMHHSPQVGILQYSCGVMNVTNTFFEAAITYFTNLVYTQIRYAVANGDTAPFVGHNAILRWSAVQEIGYDCPDDHREKWWSEATVSEDFDMSLRLQAEGYIVRLGAYTNGGFEEGVSLTVYDELARWEKYAYGCSELLFHPFKDWPKKGPITPLFRRFVASGIPLTSKITIMAYIGTYYAIGSAWILTLLNYFLVGWFNGYLDHYYNDSFKIFFAIVVVFTACGNLALAILRYRIKEKTLIPALIEVYKWVPLLTIFLGGISLHVSQAIVSHLFSIDMSWGSTNKEAKSTPFFEEIPKVAKKFKFSFAFCFVCIAMMVVLAFFVPYFWQIRLLIAVWPLGTVVFSHMMLPIMLNPGLMRFTW